MKTLTAQLKPVDTKELKIREALEKDFDTLITESCIIHEDGKPTVVYLELEDPLSDVLSAIKSIRYDRTARTGGLPTVSRIFGYSPRITIRKDFCSATALAEESPVAHRAVCSAAELVERYYKQYNPALWSEHSEVVKKVLPDYRLGETVFTSGIINKNNQLRYHRDQGNFEDCWSNMLVFKNQIGGGISPFPSTDSDSN